MKSTLLYWFTIIGVAFFFLPLTTIAQDEKVDVEREEQLILTENQEAVVPKRVQGNLSKAAIIIDQKDFNQGLINDPLQLVQGRAEGLMVAKPGGNPNDNFIARIRGVQTIGGYNDPLIVIDGFPGADLFAVDPADIASIEVLRDVASSSIYGIRGGNGAILINTKSGSIAKPIVRYTGSVAFDKVDNNVSVMSAQEYRQIFNSINFGSNTDWFEEITRVGVSQVHNLAFSGGSESIQYYASTNYRRIEGVAKNTGFERFNSRFHLKTSLLKKRGTLEFSMATTQSKHQLGYIDAFEFATTGNPTLPILYEGVAGTTNVGGYSERDIFRWYNPVSIVEQAVNDQTQSLTLGSLEASYDFSNLIDGLGASATLSGQFHSNNNGKYFPRTLKYSEGYYEGGHASKSFDQDRNNYFDTKLFYRKRISDFEFNLTGGYSYQYFYGEGFDARGGDFLTDAFLYHNLSAADDFKNGFGEVDSYAYSHKLAAFYGLLNLGFRDNIFLDAGYRYEASSMLGENNKWHAYPSLSFGGRLDKLLKINLMDYWIGRVSMGKAGRLPREPYQSLELWGPYWENVFYDGEFIPGSSVINNPNPDLGPEITNEFNLGFDLSFGDGKVATSLDWYWRNTFNMLLLVRVDTPPNIFSQSLVNLGHMKNNGFEFSIDWNVVRAPTTRYSTNFMISTFNTRVEDLSSTQYAFGENGVYYTGYFRYVGCSGMGTHKIQEGEKLGNMWGPVWTGRVEPNGVPIFQDLNGDGNTDTDQDRTVIGNGLPRWSLGWGNQIEAGRFSFNIFFRGVFGHNIISGYRVFFENFESTTIGNWNVVNTEYLNPNVQKAVLHDRHSERANYFTLDNITVRYSLPTSVDKSIKETSIFITAQGLFTITNYTGADPEVKYTYPSYSRYGNSDMTPGLEGPQTYLPTRTFSFGINMGF